MRDLNKIEENKSEKEESKMTWRRNDVMKDELEKAKREAYLANERAIEAEKKAELSEVRARLAEEKSKHSTTSSHVTGESVMSPESTGPMEIKTAPLPEDAAQPSAFRGILYILT